MALFTSNHEKGDKTREMAVSRMGDDLENCTEVRFQTGERDGGAGSLDIVMSVREARRMARWVLDNTPEYIEEYVTISGDVITHDPIKGLVVSRPKAEITMPEPSIRREAADEGD